ncbi:MAG: valine--tRNA ligase [Methanospirillum sp.]|uniref:valine--tRNA ligase n=1 Tax=Methanospirillum sp. TaxID=45200 RepID=UPI00237489D3|nr:valine--tRNA ligase [Methanospirillum sp.]MDD1728851.1 valine--tRNA ligase [Methanospirillum sp.]
MPLSDPLPKNYEYREVEARWQQIWKDEDHYFQADSEKPQFVIDTPPPYPTGEFHIGNAFNWCYIDFIARYKRMKGYNVMFPQGWDCHGLPTEVKVEETHKITKNDVPRQQFREMCRTLTIGNIEKMRASMRRMAFSIDWSHEYITMMPYYYGKTQLSFLRMMKAGQIYQSDHPVNFCPRCETAIAFAEVNYSDRTTSLNFFNFDGVEIATTRPELLAACVAVAVHPEDKRYAGKKDTSLKVPIFGHEVSIITDEAVDPSFGSGAVMICTFGDKQDVIWWRMHNLPLRKAIDKTGKMTDIAGKYAGMTTRDCRKAILADMEEQGILIRQQPLEQRVGTCWRCKTPIEILSENQWFVRIPHEAALKAAKEVKWYPEHMFLRMENWIEQMEWDWCISRQRLFATPIPVWFCKDCGEVIIPEEAELPVDPTVDQPKKPCPKCGGTSFAPETDVLDTWMDSSISVLHVTGWDGSQKTPPLFPAQIRPQGHDIIRTWAFYTILRAVSLTGGKPWEQILVNGMVLGEDGFKMSKSRGNVTVPEEILSQYGADSLRQWAAAGASTGSDIQFNWNDVVAANRFLTKMWNISRFALMQLSRESYHEKAPVTALADRWLLARLDQTVREVSDAFETYLFDKGLRAIREFAWDVLADNYIEIVKGRLYGGAGRDGACVAIQTALNSLCRMLAPYTPYFAEEVWSAAFEGSVHKQPWVDFAYTDQQALADGQMLVRIVTEVRRYKHDKNLALNAPLGTVTVYTPDIIDDAGDGSLALNCTLQFRAGKPELKQIVSGVSFAMGIIGPALRGQAKAFMQAIEALPRDQLIQLPKMVTVGTEEIPIPEGSVIPQMSYTVAGAAVEIITAQDDLIITVEQKM